MRHKHKWICYGQHSRWNPLGFVNLYECKCGMLRKDWIVGIMDQKMVLEEHYFPTGGTLNERIIRARSQGTN